MLKLDILNYGSGYYELNIVRIIKSLKDSQSLSSFEDNFKREVQNIPKKHALTAEMCFKIKWNGDQYTNPYAFIEVWHVDIDGMPDNLLARICK